LENFEIVAMSTDKKHFLRVDIGQHFHKSKKKIRLGGAGITKNQNIS
jgi:hypothetical protein